MVRHIVLPRGSDSDWWGNRAPLDQAAVDNYCTQNVKGFKAPSVIQQFSFGQSFVVSSDARI
jgi:hypothetical protein